MEEYIIQEPKNINKASRSNTAVVFGVIGVLHHLNNLIETNQTDDSIQELLKKYAVNVNDLLNKKTVMDENRESEIIQNQLITIFQNWSKTKNAPVIQEIGKFFDRPGAEINYINDFYVGDENDEIFDVQTVLANVIEDTIQHKQALNKAEKTANEMKRAFLEHMERVTPLALEKAEQVLSIYEEDESDENQ